MSDILFNPPRLSSKRFLGSIDLKAEYRFPFSVERAVVSSESQPLLLGQGLLFSPEDGRQYVLPLGATPFLGYDAITVTAQGNIIVFGSHTEEMDIRVRAAAKIEEKGPLWAIDRDGELFCAGQQLRRLEEQKAHGFLFAGGYSSIVIVFDNRDNERVRSGWIKKGLPAFDYTLSFAQAGSGNIVSNGFLPNGSVEKDLVVDPMRGLLLHQNGQIRQHSLSATAYWEEFLDEAAPVFAASYEGYLVIQERVLYLLNKEKERKKFFPLPDNFCPKGIRSNSYGTVLHGALLKNGAYCEDIVYLLDPWS